MRSPYKPGDHCHALALTKKGTALVPVTVVAATRNFDGGAGRWTITWRHPGLEGDRHANVHDNGEGEYVARRVSGCLKCVVSGAVRDGTADPITEIPA